MSDDIITYGLKGHLRTFLTASDSLDRMLAIAADIAEGEELTEIVDELFRETLEFLDFPRLLTATLGHCDECHEDHEVNEDEVREFVDSHVENARETILFMFRNILTDDSLALCSDRIDSIKEDILKQLFDKEEKKEEPKVPAMNVIDLRRKYEKR